MPTDRDRDTALDVLADSIRDALAGSGHRSASIARNDLATVVVEVVRERDEARAEVARLRVPCGRCHQGEPVNISRAFTPSSSLLSAMLSAADAKFEADREQAALRAEARENARMERALVAEAKARSERRRWR